MEKERIKELLKEDRHSGLANVKNRLNTIYGYSCNFNIKSDIGKGTKVEIKISEKGSMGGWLSKQLLSMTKRQPEKK